MTDYTTTHRGWTIEITIAKYDAACWLTAPDGNEYPCFLPKGYGINGAISCARARVNKLIEQDQAPQRAEG